MPARPLRALGVVAAFGAFAGIVLARRPGVLASPQLWAEDGMEWYARAHNAGLVRSLTRAHGGYLQTVPRLAGALCQLVPLEHAPLVMLLLAVAIEALVPLFLLSERFGEIVPGRGRRLALGLALLTAPNLFEVHMNVTNAHLHLAMLAFLILIVPPAPSRAWRTFDVAFLVASGLSGPFCVLLAPVAALVWWRRRTHWDAVRLACVLGACVVQVIVFLAPSTGRFAPPLGASVTALLDILGGQVFLAGLAGLRTYAEAYGAGWWGHPWLPRAIGVLGLAFIARAAWKTRSFALRLLLLLAASHLAAGLSSPMVLGGEPAWRLILRPGAGMRYYFFAIVAFLATVFWAAAAEPSRMLRGVAVALLAVLLLVGIPRDFRLPPYPPIDFRAEAERFRATPRGKVHLSIAPQGWTMRLRRWPRGPGGPPRESP